MTGLWIAMLLAGAPSTCRWAEIDRAIDEAARRTDEQLAARERALAIQRAELDAILRRNRAAFERGER